MLSRKTSNPNLLRLPTRQTCTELRSPLSSTCSAQVPESFLLQKLNDPLVICHSICFMLLKSPGTVHGLAFWFDVAFIGTITHYNSWEKHLIIIHVLFHQNLVHSIKIFQSCLVCQNRNHPSFRIQQHSVALNCPNSTAHTLVSGQQIL